MIFISFNPFAAKSVLHLCHIYMTVVSKLSCPLPEVTLIFTWETYNLELVTCPKATLKKLRTEMIDMFL